MKRSATAGTILFAATFLLSTPARADSRARKYYYEDIAEPFFALDPSRPGMYRNERPGSKPSLFAAVKPKDGFRVFVLGGSIAGLLQSSQGQRGDLAQALQAVLPTKKVEVLNCGMPGYESFREALVEQEILEYSPDLIVFLTGHNEGIASAPIPIWVMKAQERLSRFAAFRALVKSLHPESARAVDTAARDAAFARNLAANVRHARERGVAVAVVVPPLNAREPVDLGAMPYDADIAPGWLRFLRGDDAGARRSWREALPSEPDGRAAFVWNIVARSEENLGLLAEARESFDRAAALDRTSICGAACHATIRRVAAEQGAHLVEADRMFRALAFPRAPGLETFNDRMHWKQRFNCLVSSEIIATLRADPGLAALSWDDAGARGLKASCETPGGQGSPEDDARILSYVLMELSWPDRGSRLSTVAVFYLQTLRRHQPGWFKDVPGLLARTESPQTQVYGIERAPDAVVLPRFHWHIGEVLLLEKDYAGAAAAFREALRLDSTLSWARLSLAVAETLRGDKVGGLRLIREATERAGGDERQALVAAAVAAGAALGLGGPTEIAPSDPEQWLKRADAAAKDPKARAEALKSLARAESASRAGDRDGQFRRRVALGYQDLKEYDRALGLFSDLTRNFPAAASFRSDKALCEYLKGSDEAAVADLRVAIGLEPRFLPAYLTLGAVHSARGRYAEAITTYDAALTQAAAVDPLRAAVLSAREAALAAEPAQVQRHGDVVFDRDRQ
jgi:tetratricopeptide (TPR) repeat protein